jgi:zinc protease
VADVACLWLSRASYLGCDERRKCAGVTRLSSRRLILGLLLVSGFASAIHAASDVNKHDFVERATLSNGLRVVIVRDTLAPVVTVEMSVLAGGNESPAEFPGMAHAQEHMAFRGCTGMTSDQTAAIYSQLGGQDNAFTEQAVTHYYVTVPLPDLDVALQAQAACMRGVDDSQEEWSEERGAIEQEVAQDLSDPWYRLILRVKQDMFAGTPYIHDALGTKSSFDATTGQMLKQFHESWYAPNNMILVIAGDVDPEATLARTKELFGGTPSHDIPVRSPVVLEAVHPEAFTLKSDFANTIGVLAFRFPGTDSPDYAATRVLIDVLSSERSNLYRMESSGKTLNVNFDFAETYAKASIAYGQVESANGANARRAIRNMQRILAGYAAEGVPEELVEAAKRGELASVEFQRNSIAGLASVWSDALADEGRNSPDEDVEAIRKVTTLDVNRVARQYLDSSNAVVGTLIPSPTRHPTSEKRTSYEKKSGFEKVTSSAVQPVQLPSWAADALEQLKIPEAHALPSDMILENGLRLIVQTDSTSPTVLLRGSVRHSIDSRSDAHDGAAAEILKGLYAGGPQGMDRLAFDKALDDIGADETAGYGFALDVLKENFSRGVELLADNELHPALRPGDFKVVKRQTSRSIAGTLKSPGHRTSEALTAALLPASDPEVREIKPKAFKRVNLHAVRQFQEANIRPDLTTIVVVGDVSPDEARTVIEKWFGGWKAVGPTPNTTLPPVPINKASSVHVPDPGATQDSVILAEQLDLNRFDPDYYPLQLGNTILGGNSEGTRLYHDLRQVSGYVYDVDLDLDASETRAVYSISYGSAPENTGKARALIRRDIEQMRTGEVSAAELHQAKAFLLRQIPLSASSEEEVAEDLLDRAETGLPLDEPIREVGKYLDVNASEIREAFAKRIRPDGFVRVVRGPSF